MAFLEPAQFKGSAQSVGFNPVAISSPTEAIARNQQSQLQSLESALHMERQQLDRVNSVKVNNQKQLVNQLAFFSESLSSMLVQQAEKQNEQDMEDGLMQAYLDGIDPAEAMAFDIAEGYLKENDDQIQGIGDQVQMSGAPFMGVQKIRELSGWKGYGYAMGMAQGAGTRYASFMEEALADVPTDVTPSEKAVYLSNARSQFLRQSGLMGMNPALLNKYAFPGMREADSVFLNRWRKQQEAEIKGQMIDEAQTIMGADVVGNFSKALDLMVRGGMERRKARNELLGMLNPDEVDSLGSTMSWDGKLTWEEKYPNDFRTARRNAITSEVADYDSEQAAATLEGKRWFDDVQELWEKEPPSAADLEAAERFMSDNFNYVDSRLGDRWKGRTTEADAKAFQMDQFDRLDRAGQLTEAMLNAPDIHRDVRNTYLQKAQALDKARRDTPEFKHYTKELEESLKRVASQEGLQPSAPGLELAIARAKGDYQRYFAAAIQGGAPNAAEAAASAFARVQGDIQRGVGPNGTGTYTFKDNEGFTDVIPTGVTRDWEQHKAAMDNTFKTDGLAAIDRDALIPKATLEAAMKDINSPHYQYPPIAQYISDQFGGRITPWEILNRQAQAQGLGELPMNPRLQSQVQGLSPEMVRLLTYKPSYNRTARAFGSTGTFNPAVVPRGYGAIVQQASAKYGIDPSILAGLLEVESNFNPKARSGAGAQGIAQIMPGYHPGVNTWNANESIMYAAKYLSELHSQLGSMDEAIYAYNGGPGGIRESAENRAYHPKVMRAAAKYGFNSGGSPWRNPAFLNPRIAYVTGNDGPTSTGPHLDVKQTDGKDFSSTALDRYVEVDDPEYGRVPLSRVGVTADAANHRRRGSHGIDYGTHSGSRVYLKGGAKVVGSVRTEHGDKVTIQLPNGQKYTFLHGRSA